MSDRRLPTMTEGVIVEHLIDTPEHREATYRELATGLRWVLAGTCNNCGLCYIGTEREAEFVAPAGTPDALPDALAPDRWYETMTPGFIEDMQQMAAETPGAMVDGCAFAITVIEPAEPEV